MGFEKFWKKVKEGPKTVYDDKGVPRVGSKEGWPDMDKMTPEQRAEQQKEALGGDSFFRGA